MKFNLLGHDKSCPYNGRGMTCLPVGKVHHARYLLLLVFCFNFGGMSASAQSTVNLDTFKNIPILDEGRVKPLDTYAQNLLLRFSGRRSFDRKPAIEWLARLLLDSDSVRDDKIFMINSLDIPMALKIEPAKKRRYSYAQIEPEFVKIIQLAEVAETIAEKERSIVEQEVLRLYYNMMQYAKLTQALSFARPHDDFHVHDAALRKKIHLPAEQTKFSFWDIVTRSEHLYALTEKLEDTTPEFWSEGDKALMGLVSNLYQWSLLYHKIPFAVVPTDIAEDETWLSPWDILRENFHNEIIRKEIGLLHTIAVGYRTKDQKMFDAAAKAFTDSLAGRVIKKQRKNIEKIPLELQYNKRHFFLWAKLLYGLAFFLFLFSFFKSTPILRAASLWIIGVGFASQLTGVIMRCIIMSRPPVTNLYETFVFVGLICVLLGVIVELVNKRWLGIMVASLLGLLFLMISAKFSAEGDTMRMMVAVLDSNFWLATHVVTITIGYAGCSVAGLIGHMYLIQRMMPSCNAQTLQSTYRNLLGTLIFGLATTFLGTFLGGIWADQSWGRFWGWDPKENGALLIVLWCSIILHAKVGRLIGQKGVAIFSALGLIVVMWAWFGVNLLNVGLHSYGFTSGIATGLIVYVIAEIIFLTFSGFYLRKKT